VARSFSGWSVARLRQYIRDTIRNKVYFKEQATAPDVRSGVEEAVIYAKDDSGTTKLYYKDSASTEYTLGGGGGGAVDVGWSGPSADVISTTGSVGIGTTGPDTGLMIRQDESTTLTDFTQAVSKAGLLINTDYTTDAYTPGLYWNTEDNNATKPKGGIYLKETTLGTHLYLGTSNHYATGITTNTIIDQDGNVGIGTVAPIAELDVAGKIAITAESSTPAQPSDGDGYLYSKSDGKIYWRSYDLSETDLTATGGGGSGTDVGWTGPSSGVISTTGSTGLGSTAPDRKLEITNGTTELLTRLTYNDTNGSAANYVDLGVDSGGAFIVSPSETTPGSAAGNWPIQLYAGGGSSNTIHLAIGGNEIQAKDDDSNAGDLYLQYHGGDMGLCDGGGTLTVGGKVGIGATSPDAQLEVEVADSENMAGILVDFNETGGYTAFEVDSESTQNYAAHIQGKYGMSVVQDITSGRGLKVSRNIDETGSLALAYFHDDHATNTRPTMIVQQDGTGDIISLYSGSSQVVTFTNEGKVGIGDTTPDAQLEVVVADAAATKGLLVDFNETSGYAAFHVDSESTTHYTAFLQGKFGALIEQDITSGRGLKVTRDIAETGSLALVYFHDDNSFNKQTTLSVRQDGTGDILNLFAGSTEVMTVADNGSVGIGVEEPIVRLHIETTSGPSLYLTRDDSTISADEVLGVVGFGGTQDSGVSYDTQALITGRASSTWTSGSDTPTYLQFYTTPDGTSAVAEHMRITSEGDVGIGATTPGKRLEITDGTNEHLLRLAYNHAGGGSATNRVDLGVDSGGAFVLSPSEGSVASAASNYPVQIYNSSNYTDTYHLGLDSNEIQAKSDDSTASTLYLNPQGGEVKVGTAAAATTLESLYNDFGSATGYIRSKGSIYAVIDRDNDGTTSKFAVLANMTTIVAEVDEVGNLQIDGDFTVDGNQISGSDGAVLSFDSGMTGIDTTTPKVPLDLYEMGGLSVAMTHLMPASDTSYTTTTGYVVPTSDWKITFTAPANGKIEIMFSGLIAMAAASDDYIYLGLSDNSTYNTLGAQYEKHAYQASTGDNVIIEYSWLVTGLTGGTSYTYYVGSKYSGGGPAPAWYWGGTSADEYPPILIKALTVPDTIYAG